MHPRPPPNPSNFLIGGSRRRQVAEPAPPIRPADPPRPAIIRGMKRCLLLGFVCLAVSIAAWQVAGRQTQVGRLAPLVGDWKMKVHLEMGDVKDDLTGTMTATWALDKTYVNLNAKLDNGSKLEGTGFVTFDDNAKYEKRQYRGYFLWSADGRCLPLQGDLTEDKLVMLGQALSLGESEVPQVRVNTTFKDKDHIDVTVEAHAGDDESKKFSEFLTFSFVRQ